MSKYWTMVLPSALGGVIYYAYSRPGFSGHWVQKVVNPLLELGGTVLNFVFGI